MSVDKRLGGPEFGMSSSSRSSSRTVILDVVFLLFSVRENRFY